MDWNEKIDGLVSLDEASQRLGVGPATLREWRKKYEHIEFAGLFVKKGKHLWFDLRKFAEDAAAQQETEIERARRLAQRNFLGIRKAFALPVMFGGILAFGVAIWLAGRFFGKF